MTTPTTNKPTVAATPQPTTAKSVETAPVTKADAGEAPIEPVTQPIDLPDPDPSVVPATTLPPEPNEPNLIPKSPANNATPGVGEPWDQVQETNASLPSPGSSAWTAMMQKAQAEKSED